MKVNFSVSMCVYEKDNPLWLKQSVESILHQTACPNEIVLVVDGPISNELDAIIYEYSNNTLFNIIRLKENQGHGNARRIGLDNCKYDLVALMDADDISEPMRFEKQLSVFEKEPGLSAVGGQIAEFVDAPDVIVGRRVVPETDECIKKYLKKRCPFNQVTVMFKKSDVQNVGGYIDWYCNEDYYLWLRMYLKNMKFANHPDTLVNVRVGKDMYKRRGGIKYFKSEYKLQKYMFKNKIIGVATFFINVIKRFIVQVLLPNSIRGYVFKKFART